MTKLSFSSNETVTLEKKIDLPSAVVETKPEDLDEVYEIDRCVEWIQSNTFKKVCLQFPDHLLPDSSQIVLKLQETLNQTIYLLGDTAYESCCIDYIAAAHINADAIIHFGPVCFSKPSANIPILNIYEKYSLNLNDLEAHYNEYFGNKENQIKVIVDSVYIYLYNELEELFQNNKNFELTRIDKLDQIAFDSKIFFIGNNQRKLLNLALNFKPMVLYYYDTSIKIFDNASKIIKRRNYIIEMIKDSVTIGIVIGTLGIKNYLKILDRLKTLISNSGKKYYLISVGKPTIAKLANFPELDIYVVVTCAMSEIYESRDFYKPIATPFDVEAALNKHAERNFKFTYDYNVFVDDLTSTTTNEIVADVSLLTNRLRPPIGNDQTNQGVKQSSLAVQNDGTIALTNFGAGYLTQRSWKGVEQKLGKTEVHLAKEGRSGIPFQYNNESM